MNFDKLVNIYCEDEQTTFPFIKDEKKEETKVVPEVKTDEELIELSKNDDSPRLFKVLWDGFMYDTVASSKESAIGNIAFRLTKGTNKPTGVLRNKMKSIRVRDMRWNVKY
jgi:hypothetical protein